MGINNIPCGFAPSKIVMTYYGHTITYENGAMTTSVVNSSAQVTDGNGDARGSGGSGSATISDVVTFYDFSSQGFKVKRVDSGTNGLQYTILCYR